MSYTASTFSPVSSQATKPSRIYSYTSSDVIGTVETPGYFADTQHKLKVGDIIFIRAGGNVYIDDVTSLDPVTISRTITASGGSAELFTKTTGDFAQASDGTWWVNVVHGYSDIVMEVTLELPGQGGLGYQLGQPAYIDDDTTSGTRVVHFAIRPANCKIKIVGVT